MIQAIDTAKRLFRPLFSYAIAGSFIAILLGFVPAPDDTIMALLEFCLYVVITVFFGERAVGNLLPKFGRYAEQRRRPYDSTDRPYGEKTPSHDNTA